MVIWPTDLEKAALVTIVLLRSYKGNRIRNGHSQLRFKSRVTSLDVPRLSISFWHVKFLEKISQGLTKFVSVTYLEVVEDGAAVVRGHGVVDGHDDALVAAVLEKRRSGEAHKVEAPHDS